MDGRDKSNRLDYIWAIIKGKLREKMCSASKQLYNENGGGRVSQNYISALWLGLT